MSVHESRGWTRSILVAILLGLVAGSLALAFVTVEHWLQHWLWETLPERLGYDVPSWWLILLIPLAGGLLTAAARQLPGDGGHDPIKGFTEMATLPQYLPSALLAALASLAFGAVLGPEAPLLALGTACGLVMAKVLRVPPEATQFLMLAGAFAAFGVVFGNPLNSAVLLIELTVLASAGRVVPLLLPGLVAAGTGYLLFTGVGDWVGVEAASLAIPGVVAPETLLATELLWAVVIGGLAAVLVYGIKRLMPETAAVIRKVPLFPLLGGAGLALGLMALLYEALTDRDPLHILFSGQESLDELLVETSVGVLLLFALIKTAAYVLSAAAGFRGGLIFPVLGIAVALALAGGLFLPGLGATAALSAAIAASMSGFLKAPFSGVVFAVLLLGEAGDVMTPVAILASATAYVVAVRLEHAGVKEVPSPPTQKSPLPEKSAR